MLDTGTGFLFFDIQNTCMKDVAKSIIRIAKEILAYESFPFMGFQVTAEGLKTDNWSVTKNVLKVLAKSLGDVKGKGFGHLLYGRMLIVSEKLKSSLVDFSGKTVPVDAAAYYNINGDMIVINADEILRSGTSSMDILVHELGHREWFKFLSPTQKKTWTGDYERRIGLVLTDEMVDHINSLFRACAKEEVAFNGFVYHSWDKFDREKFKRLIRKFEPRLHTESLLMKILGVENKRKLVDTMMNEMEINIEVYGGFGWCARNLRLITQYKKGEISIDEVPYFLKRYVDLEDGGHEAEYAEVHLRETEKRGFAFLVINRGKVYTLPHSTSEYGRNNDWEDYAEAFRAYVLNKEMPEDIFAKFAEVHHFRKASSRNKVDMWYDRNTNK